MRCRVPVLMTGQGISEIEKFVVVFALLVNTVVVRRNVLEAGAHLSMTEVPRPMQVLYVLVWLED